MHDTHVFSYLTSPNSVRYRQIMQSLLHRRSFRLRLTAAQISDLLWELFERRPSADELEADLEQLYRWEAVERQQDTSAAATTVDFKRKRFTYDITAQGEIAERAALALDSSERRIGALDRARLEAMLADMRLLAAATAVSPMDGQQLATLMDALHSKLIALRDSATGFMRDLGQVMGFEEAISEQTFTAYKNKVVDHLSGFKAAQTRTEPEFERLIGEIEAVGIQRLCQQAASADPPPRYDMTVDEVIAVRIETLLEQWSAVRHWFVGNDREQPPWRELDRSLSDAIAWIVQTAQRLLDRRQQRVDRSAEYRHLARLFADADDSECHALYSAVFGLFSPRHLSVREEDPELTSARQSWWDGARAPVETHLRRPTSRDPGAGRTASINDFSEARERLRARRQRERAELEAARARFAGRGPLNVADFADLEASEFAHLLGWLGRATEAPRSADGRKVADSADGSVRIALTLPDTAEGTTLPPTVELRTAAGVLRCPDFQVEFTALG
jgi:uncharacterized protein (TIGR02677 family)